MPDDQFGRTADIAKDGKWKQNEGLRTPTSYKWDVRKWNETLCAQSNSAKTSMTLGQLFPTFLGMYTRLQVSATLDT